jgi:hypothetical protein
MADTAIDFILFFVIFDFSYGVAMALWASYMGF